jgi:uncharacterized protein (DUF1501 family)
VGKGARWRRAHNCNSNAELIGGHAAGRFRVHRLCQPYGLLRAVIKGVLHDHLGVSERVLAETVFPESAGVKAARGLVG